MIKKIILAIIVLLSAIQINAKELTFATNINEDYPHLIGNSDKFYWANPGITVEILQIVARNVGITINFIRAPWIRCLKGLEQGEIDAVFFASYKKEREKFGVFPVKDGKIDEEKRYAYAPYAFYKLKTDDIKWDGIKITNLNKGIGTSLGYSISNFLKEKGYNVEENINPLNDFKKLALKRVGLVAALQHNGDYILYNHPHLKKVIEKIDEPIINKAYYLLVSHQLIKKDKNLVEEIWNSLEQARIRYYDAIYLKYIKLMD